MATLSAALAVVGIAAAVTFSPEDPLVRILPQIPLGLDPFLPEPRDNRMTRSKVALGRRLFFDPALSQSQAISCATCHVPELAFTDGRKRAQGHAGRIGRRNTPSLLNSGYRRSLFWDGRSTSLEALALLPIENPDEMAHSVPAVLAELAADGTYRAAVAAAFGDPEMTRDRLAAALAAFQRTLVTADTPFDRYLQWGDDLAISDAARRGYALFEGRARCRFCHTGSRFTDDRFHNTGVGFGQPPLDRGRFEVTGRVADTGRFRTGTLRGLVSTAPYMHDGSFATLEEVVEFYNRGGAANPHLDGAVQPLHLSVQERADLVAFLRALSREPGG